MKKFISHTEKFENPPKFTEKPKKKVKKIIAPSKPIKFEKIKKVEVNKKEHETNIKKGINALMRNIEGKEDDTQDNVIYIRERQPDYDNEKNYEDEFQSYMDDYYYRRSKNDTIDKNEEFKSFLSKFGDSNRMSK